MTDKNNKNNRSSESNKNNKNNKNNNRNNRSNKSGKLEGRRIKVIGLGGIGANVALAIAQFLSTRQASCSLWLIDGDSYEERNRERVVFQSYDNKAVAKAREFTVATSNRVTIIPVPRYVTSGNARRLIEEGDVVFLCVDNHATRKAVSNRCGKLDNVALFSGGNDGVEGEQEGTFGNVQVYLRESGRDITNSLTRFHPEIAHPEDKSPSRPGCADLAAQAAPQLLFTNLAVASAMLGAFYSWLQGGLSYEEIYLDISLGKATPVKRAAPGRKAKK
jgi:molybdopterin/thiamine biosynthesis adenylyltransferase